MSWTVLAQSDEQGGRLYNKTQADAFKVQLIVTSINRSSFIWRHFEINIEVAADLFERIAPFLEFQIGRRHNHRFHIKKNSLIITLKQL